MLFLIGVVVVAGCVVGGYLGAGGHLNVLWQPFEFVIIFGSAIGAFAIANPKPILGGVVKSFSKIVKGPKYNKNAYLEVLGILYAVFKLAKTKGDLALESHIEKPHQSSIFQHFPSFIRDQHALDFLCDYLRLLTLGGTNSHEIESVMEAELEIHHGETHAVATALQTVADGLPALGIVAAVLGVIHTMGSITEPPEVLGHLIGGALVGTFTGVLAAYGLVAPIAKSLENTFESESRYLECIKTGLVAHMQGYAPQVSVEIARKALNSNVRPSFAELDELIQTSQV